MSHCLCPNCGVELTVSAGLRPSPQQRQPQPQRRQANPHGPSTLAEALDYELPLGKYKGRRLADVARTDPAWIRWAAATLDRSAGKACSIVLGSLDADAPPPADRSPEVEDAMAAGAY